MSAVDILTEYRNFVWPEVYKYLKNPVFPKDFRIPPDYQKVVDNAFWKVVKDYPNRKGKYLRPTLLLLTSEAMGINKIAALKTATAMQLSEEWILVHDDIMDKSLERRGQPTLQRIYGDELAVNAGDALQVIMWKSIFDNITKLGVKKTREVAEEFYSFLSRTAQGQAVEVKWILENKYKLGDKDWLFLADGKSAYYTVAGPMRLGAIIANATARQLSLLTKFGLHLGRCFQLVDDLLDITSEFSGLKKQRGNDIFEGKRTLMLCHLLRNIKGKDRTKLFNIYKKGREQKTQEDVEWVINKMENYGSISYAKKLAIRFKDNSMKIFENELNFLSKQLARTKLETLINFVLERTY